MADDCLPQVHADVIRLCNLDTNGTPLPGPNNLYISSALTTLTFSPDIEDGDEINEKNAAGESCVVFQGDPTLRWVNVTIELCSPDPYLEAMLSQGTVIPPDVWGGDEDDPAGYAFPPLGVISSKGGISLEVWCKRINNGDLDPDFPYAWWALPKINKLRPADRNFGNEAQKPSFSGTALENPNWFDGPLNDWPATSDRVAQWVPTISKPVAQCGPTAVPVS